MSILRVPYRWVPRRYWSNLSYLWSDLTQGVANVFRWIPVIWFDRDWDWCHLADVMEYKLRRMAHLEETVGHHVGSKRDAKRMRVCADLLKRLNDDEYWESAVKRFGETPHAAKFCQQHSENDKRYLGMILGKYLNHWWD